MREVICPRSQLRRRRAGHEAHPWASGDRSQERRPSPRVPRFSRTAWGQVAAKRASSEARLPSRLWPPEVPEAASPTVGRQGLSLDLTVCGSPSPAGSSRPHEAFRQAVLQLQFQSAAWPSVTTPPRALVQPKCHMKKDLFARPQTAAETDRPPGASRAGAGGHPRLCSHTWKGSEKEGRNAGKDRTLPPGRMDSHVP